MKKKLAIILALLFILPLAACSGSGSTSAPAQTAGGETAVATETAEPETTVITPDLNFATTAAIGAAISLMRDLNITAPEAKPHIDAYEVMPSQSAVIYQAHARIHAFLSKESDGYAG